MTARPQRERLKFADFEFTKLPSGRCRSKVVLQLTPGSFFHGESEGLGSQTGELRVAAQAAVVALERAVEDKVKLELLGVKAVRAFDAIVVIVSLSCRNDAPAQRIVGSYLSDRDVPRGAAIAVLNATNRLMGNIIHAR